jgi:hypothetical protein
MERKPRKVKAKITRVVTEIVIATLDSDGNVDEIEDVCAELEWDDCEILAIIDVIS